MSIRQGNSLIAGTPDITGKADTDLSNLSSTGKSTGAELAMPSDNYVDLTLPQVGYSIEVPANGYVFISGTATTASSYVAFVKRVSGVNILGSSVTATSRKDQDLWTSLAVRGGDNIIVGYGNVNVRSFCFVYAQGEI